MRLSLEVHVSYEDDEVSGSEGCCKTLSWRQSDVNVDDRKKEGKERRQGHVIYVLISYAYEVNMASYKNNMINAT